MTAPSTLAIYAGAAIAEIAGCFAVWAWMRQGASALWLIPGILPHILYYTAMKFSHEDHYLFFFS